MADTKVSELATASGSVNSGTDWLLISRGSASNKIRPPGPISASLLDAGTSTQNRFATAAAFAKMTRWMGAFVSNTAKRVGEFFTSGGGVYVVDTAIAANASDTTANLKRIDNPPNMTAAQANAGTDSTPRTPTAAIIKGAIDTHAPQNPPNMTSAQATTGTDTTPRTPTAAIIKAAIDTHAPNAVSAGVSDDAGQVVRGLLVAVDSGSGDVSNLTILRGVRSASEVSVTNVPYIMDDSNINTSGDPALDASKTNQIVIKDSEGNFTYKEPIRNQLITIVSDVIDSNDDQGILGRYIYTGASGASAWKELVEGKNNSRTYFNNFVAGEDMTASGQFSHAIGRSSEATATGSIVIGRNNSNSAAAVTSLTLGERLHNKIANAVLVGKQGVLATAKRFAVAGGDSNPTSGEIAGNANVDIVFSVDDSGVAESAKIRTPHASDSGATGTSIRFHALTQSAYDAISSKDSDTFYIING